MNEPTKIFLAIQIEPSAYYGMKLIQQTYNTGDFKWYENNGETIFPILENNQDRFVAYLVADKKEIE